MNNNIKKQCITCKFYKKIGGLYSCIAPRDEYFVDNIFKILANPQENYNKFSNCCFHKFDLINGLINEYSKRVEIDDYLLDIFKSLFKVILVNILNLIIIIYYLGSLIEIVEFNNYTTLLLILNILGIWFFENLKYKFMRFINNDK